jgi:predicted dinucleotide-binding enzyme
MSRIVILAGDGRLGPQLADLYRAAGDEVHLIAAPAAKDLPAAVAPFARQPVDLFISAIDDHPAPLSAGGVSREALSRALEIFTFVPFRLAILLRQNLAMAKGRAVLLSAATATMGAVDIEGHYLERPFRAAAHQMWRSIATEWKSEGIVCPLIAIDDALTLAALPAVIDNAPSGELIDQAGRALAW